MADDKHSPKEVSEIFGKALQESLYRELRGSLYKGTSLRSTAPSLENLREAQKEQK